MDREKTIVSIPSKLTEKVEEKIKETDIKTVSEYITFLLRMVLSEEGKIKNVDEKKIKEKLKKLGYL
ncbi:CopG family transcriptional regulator [Candidatus Woesearchaeota archaeon]|nr:CopG family transcriptional regulator [Candidatus Woesearchaeota archaeon]